MSTEENKAIARRHYEEVWNKGRVELLDDYWSFKEPAGDAASLEGIREAILWNHKFTPGFYFTIKDVVGEGDTVVVNWKVNVTYSVPPDSPLNHPIPPLGKPVEWKGMTLLRFADGKIVHLDSANLHKSMLVDIGVYTLAKPEPA